MMNWKRFLPLFLLVIILAVGSSTAFASPKRTFVAPLSGAEEVPPVETRARGQAIFQLSGDGSQLSYRLNVANLENVTMAHIHLAPAGVNGPVVAWLFGELIGDELTAGSFNGILAEGTITAEDLVGPLAGLTMEHLLEEIREGNTYVNVHTSQIPAGEIRGQIR
jgi:hypothetical protein